MKNGSIIALIALVILVVGVVWYFGFNNQPKQTCTNQDGYCIYNNVPSYLQYSSPQIFEVDANLQINPRDYFLDYSGLTKVSDLVCEDDGKKARVIEYFYGLCEGQEGLDGCGYERRAILCEKNYFVQDFSSSYGPRYFGPFEYS